GVGTVLPKFPFGVDGLVSATENLLLSVRSADCVPILLYDPVQKVCSAVHAGWRGTVGGIAANAVLEMQKHGCKAADILVAIGPCIGVCCYEVGTEVYDAFLQVDACFASCFVPHGDRYLLDLTRANTLFLTRAGVAEHHIDACGMCTRCDETEWFSHRRMGANRGTMSAFITV
ncbi:MAG: peptidoglycan editing factor PgeF, partial [Clostridia bacterium]|nr:peptidoglycan editing factor PgeF [Clostridia bacterium]